MYLPTPEPEIQEADILIRPKQSGSGNHYGTAVRTDSVFPPNALHGFYPKYLAAHKMPGIGKHVSTIESFGAGKPVHRIRHRRTAQQRGQVEQIAISDLGAPYLVFDNCETDVNRVHAGVAISPTANTVLAWTVGGIIVWQIFAAFNRRR
jgi:hypothetical protein